MFLPGTCASIWNVANPELGAWLRMGPVDAAKLPVHMNRPNLIPLSSTVNLPHGTIVIIIGCEYASQGIATVLSPMGFGHVWADCLKPIQSHGGNQLNF